MRWLPSDVPYVWVYPQYTQSREDEGSRTSPHLFFSSLYSRRKRHMYIFGGLRVVCFLSVGIMLVINHRVLCWNGLLLEMSPGSAAPSARYRSSAPLNVCRGLPLAHTPGAEPADRDIFNSAPPIPQLSGMLSNLHSVCSPLLLFEIQIYICSSETHATPGKMHMEPSQRGTSWSP